MQNKRKVFRLRFLFCKFFLLMLLVPFELLAQDMWGKYCIFGHDGVKICRESVEEVLSEYDHVPRSREPAGEILASMEPNTLIIPYRIKYSEPESVSDDLYNYGSHFSFTSGAIKHIPGCSRYGCPAEDAAIDQVVKEVRERSPGATYIISGGYSNEFKIAGLSSLLDFSGDRKIDFF